MAIPQTLVLAGELLVKLVPSLIDIIAEAIGDGGEAKAEELRKQPITVSIAFGGGEGEAVKVQREIEGNLPDEPAETTDPPA